MLQRVRELLFPILVMSIISSIWVIGRTQEMEEDVRFGVGPSPRWAAVNKMMLRSDAE